MLQVSRIYSYMLRHGESFFNWASVSRQLLLSILRKKLKDAVKKETISEDTQVTLPAQKCPKDKLIYGKNREASKHSPKIFNVKRETRQKRMHEGKTLCEKNKKEKLTCQQNS